MNSPWMAPAAKAATTPQSTATSKFGGGSADRTPKGSKEQAEAQDEEKEGRKTQRRAIDAPKRRSIVPPIKIPRHPGPPMLRLPSIIPGEQSWQVGKQPPKPKPKPKPKKKKPETPPPETPPPEPIRRGRRGSFQATAGEVSNGDAEANAAALAHFAAPDSR